MVRKLSYSFTLIAVLLLLFSACEKDDICLEPATPKLVIRFYDIANPDEFKAVEDLQIVLDSQSDTIKFGTKDSIAIPLDVNNNSCQYKFITGTNPDVLFFTYQREDVFISKTCGYKTYFHQLAVDIQPDADNWIRQIEIIHNSVTIDTIAHVKVYH